MQTFFCVPQHGYNSFLNRCLEACGQIGSLFRRKFLVRLASDRFIEAWTEPAVTETVGVEKTQIRVRPFRSALMQDLSKQGQVSTLAPCGQPLRLVLIRPRLKAQ